MRRLVALVAFTLACATVPAHQRTPPPTAGIPLEVQNRAVEDVTVYVVTDAVAWRIGRAVGTGTTHLGIPRSFEHQLIRTAVRFDGGGRTIYSPRFVLPFDGVTMIVDPRDVRANGPRS